MRQNALAIIVALFVSVGCASHGRSAAAGAEEARQDIIAGHLELRVYGLIGPEDHAFAQLMQEKLGVQVVRVADCVIDGAQLQKTDAYNRMMADEFERRFGAGSVERVRSEAATVPHS